MYSKCKICVYFFRTDESDNEMDDFEISKLMIVTQTPPPPKKHDRTGNFTTRSKMTAELAQVISDGLYYYEQDFLDDDEESYLSKKVNTNKQLYLLFGLLAGRPSVEADNQLAVVSGHEAWIVSVKFGVCGNMWSCG